MPTFSLFRIVHRPETAAPFILGAFMLSLCTAACGGGGSSDHKVPARVITGGGVGDAPIAGFLNVYAVDGDSDAPISGAAVRVATASATAGCNGTTDSTGLVMFDPMTCPGLKGKQTVTVSAVNRVPATWIGVTGANLTIPLDQTTSAAVPTATVMGTIAGWNDVPPPAAGHATLGLVASSQSRPFGAAENEIGQGTRNIMVGALPFVIPANACVRTDAANDCNFRLTTRTGPQAHFAIIIDQDTKGTPLDDTDDTFSILGYALTRGLSLAAGETVGAETLTRIPDADVVSATVTISGAPSALEDVAFLPVVDLGDEGRLIIPVLGTGAATTTGGTARVPKSTGVLAGTRFEVIALAQDAVDDDLPSSLVWRRGLDAATAVTIGGFMPAPTGLAVTAGTYSFASITGATVVAASIEDATGRSYWDVTLLDGSTSFTLPGLDPDPLPAGMLRYKVTAIDVPGLDLGNFRTEDAVEQLARLAEDDIAFTR